MVYESFSYNFFVRIFFWYLDEMINTTNKLTQTKLKYLIRTKATTKNVKPILQIFYQFISNIKQA